MNETAERPMNETANKKMNETARRTMNETAKRTMNENAKKRMRKQMPSEQLAFNGQLGSGALGPGPRAQNSGK